MQHPSTRENCVTAQKATIWSQAFVHCCYTRYYYYYFEGRKVCLLPKSQFLCITLTEFL